MKKYLLVFVIIISSVVNAQFKDPVFPTGTPKDGIIDNSSGSLFGFLSSENFSMHHSVGVSYSSIGGYGTSLATYTNSMMYKFSDKMNVQLDASFITSPYSSFGKDFQNSLQGVYISRAAFNYKPWDDVSISFQYRSMPNYYYNPFNRYNGYYGNSFYDGFFGSAHDSFMY
ncbi:MAG: hypothetical protein Q8M94_10785 [Ignavibacteria bacterium]|nr:hypothetical protein [Ignavibacteria bacterium]